MIYKPKSSLEKFGKKIFTLLVDNFPQTFYVGGMVRDLLLKIPVMDIDIATSAGPDEIIKMLGEAGVSFDISHKQFGIVIAKNKHQRVEIATLRKDSYSSSRYPKITFVKTAKQDSQRRDFSINALYLKPYSGKILDFHKGSKDFKDKQIKFIGNPDTKILQDPLRIIRALRFSQALNFKIENQAKKAINKNFNLIKFLTKSRIKNELDKIKYPKHKKIILKIISKQKIA